MHAQLSATGHIGNGCPGTYSKLLSSCENLMNTFWIWVSAGLRYRAGKPLADKLAAPVKSVFPKSLFENHQRFIVFVGFACPIPDFTFDISFFFHIFLTCLYFCLSIFFGLLCGSCCRYLFLLALFLSRSVFLSTDVVTELTRVIVSTTALFSSGIQSQQSWHRTFSCSHALLLLQTYRLSDRTFFAAPAARQLDDNKIVFHLAHDFTKFFHKLIFCPLGMYTVWTFFAPGITRSRGFAIFFLRRFCRGPELANCASKMALSFTFAFTYFFNEASNSWPVISIKQGTSLGKRQHELSYLPFSATALPFGLSSIWAIPAAARLGLGMRLLLLLTICSVASLEAALGADATSLFLSTIFMGSTLLPKY